jgi:hypothetical protein
MLTPFSKVHIRRTCRFKLPNLLAVNLKTAKALGLEAATSIVLRAHEVIE